VTGFEADADGTPQPRFAASSGGFGSRQREHPPLAEDAAIIPVLSSRGAPPELFLGQLTDFVERRQIPFVLVTGWPLVDWLPDATGCLVTLGASLPVAAAAAAVLAGEAEPTATLPGLI
jgi:hypothetical protein